MWKNVKSDVQNREENHEKKEAFWPNDYEFAKVTKNWQTFETMKMVKDAVSVSKYVLFSAKNIQNLNI